jgi:hypothetical protein
VRYRGEGSRSRHERRWFKVIDVEVLRTALDPSSMDVPKRVRNAFEKAARVKSFVTVPGGAALIRGSVLIAVYGDAPREHGDSRAARP